MHRPFVGTLSLTIVLAACAGGTPSPSTSPAPAPGADAAMLRAAAVADSVRNSYSPADSAFMVGMIGHHAQAIVMSKWAPSHGASPEMRVLTARIINSQRDEIALMERWLRDHHLPVPVADTIDKHMSMGAGHMMMPGMLSNAQMDSLDAARGEEFDRLFLRFMIQHHTGALTMVDELFASHAGAQNDRIYKFASDVYADQGTEIGRMRKMLFLMQLQSGSD